MSNSQPWYRSNLRLLPFMPLGVVGIAYSQVSLEGTAQDVVAGVFVVILLAFVISVAVNARARRSDGETPISV